ncbi:hypothetical protein BC351_11475 [Paenibacillus ferrarius]|uniref:Uncharacterized protein n=1 Tax=Paenibacillus ferrarius TaxID=1469647 RepID=A0A1V4H7K8_9BACL|nr:hypothetical protein [Paenibacillus ferrarius]OPH47124.1 hypothetical protein BC351_11475 [Paenibacillus ferrarius]
MKETIVADITKPKSRRCLYHFTRIKNLPAMAHFDTLFSSYMLNPVLPGERRTSALNAIYKEHAITINAHLRIPDSMIDPSTSQEQFRACIDRHVFFWPTLKDCQKMLATYTRREPHEGFAVLEFDASALLLAHYSEVKLSKYDSGSSPRYPKSCSYKKSPEMFLPLNSYKTVKNHLVPTKASEIREVVVEDQVTLISHYLRAVYADHREAIPARWESLVKPLANLQQENM